MWTAAANAADAETLRAAWEADAAVIQQDGHMVARFEGSDFVALAKGKTVTRRVDGPDGSTATGAILIPAGVQGPWIAVQDPYDRPLASGVRLEEATPDHEGGHAVWYLLDLPWPLADRQWVSEARNNRKLYEASAGRVWERYWGLQAPATAAQISASAVWVPVNHGSWVMLRVGGDTVAVFSARATLGGALPSNLAVTYAMSTLERLLERVRDHGVDQATHYRQGHKFVYDPGGTEIPYWP